MNLFYKIKHFLSFILISIKKTFNNTELLAPKNIIEIRKSICNQCPKKINGTFLKKDKCSICGCFLSWKIKMATEYCPDTPSKWTWYIEE